MNKATPMNYGCEQTEEQTEDINGRFVFYGIHFCILSPESFAFINLNSTDFPCKV
jgi:hypothetical protein